MQISALVRDRAKVLATLVTRSDNSVVTKTGCKICYPARFVERFLAQTGVESMCIGLFPVIVEDKYYSLVNVNAYISLKPSRTEIRPIQGVDYYVLEFEPGSIVFETLELVQVSDVIFRLFDELFSKGKVPWYIGYEDMGSIFDTASTYAGVNVGSNPEVIQLLAAIVSRDKDNRTTYYRQTVNSRSDLVNRPPVYIPLKSVYYAATSTVTKLAGSYFSDGVTSALLTPSDRVEQIEDILRA